MKKALFLSAVLTTSAWAAAPVLGAGLGGGAPDHGPSSGPDVGSTGRGCVCDIAVALRGRAT